MSNRFAQTYEDLEVFQMAFAASLELHKATLTFPKIEQYALADQLRRSTKSVCSNVAEGFGRQRGSKAEFKRFVLLALGSSDETQVWLKYAFELGYITEQQLREWKETYGRISRMLQALYTSISGDR